MGFFGIFYGVVYKVHRKKWGSSSENVEWRIEKPDKILYNNKCSAIIKKGEST